MREFNTSGPNIPRLHYTIKRTNLIEEGIKLVQKERYFTIWAPRQTGKSTYFRQLAEELKKLDYKIAHINFENYKLYVKRRGFKPFLKKDEQGQYKSIKESAFLYSFETFITAIIQEISGKIYREADTGLGKSDMIINVDNHEFLIEAKVYSGPKRFATGKEQLVYYADSLGLKKAVYLVFLSKRARIPENVKEHTEIIHLKNTVPIEVSTYLIDYDTTKW